MIWGDQVADRRAEIQSLADVFRQIQDMDPSEQDVILAGDFNRDPTDLQSFGRAQEISSMVSLFNPPQKSHIKDTSL